MSMSLSLGLSLGAANLNAGGGAPNLLLFPTDFSQTPPWARERVTINPVPVAGPTGALDGWEVICTGGPDAIFSQALDVGEALTGKDFIYEIWAKTADPKSHSSYFNFYGYTGTVQQVQLSTGQPTTGGWQKFTFPVSFTSTAETELVFRIDLFDGVDGDDTPDADASIYFARSRVSLA